MQIIRLTINEFYLTLIYLVNIVAMKTTFIEGYWPIYLSFIKIILLCRQSLINLRLYYIYSLNRSIILSSNNFSSVFYDFIF